MLQKPVLREYSVVGKRVAKIDAIPKVTGEALFLQDLKLPSMLYGKILRSRYPHARIRSVDTSKAETLSGVIAVLTAKDTPLIRFGFKKDQLPLKHEKVRSVRDEVAAVAAVDEETAVRALELIDVEYEELPGVFDPLEAMKPTAPLIHEETDSNVVKLPFRFDYGDIDHAFANADCVQEATFQLHFVNAMALGTMGCIASVDNAGNLTVYTNTQAPFQHQKELADALGIDGSRVRVIQPKIGGSFGRGMALYPIDIITALLALKTRRPVKIVLTREEELAYAPTRQPVIIKLKTAANRDGTLVAREALCYLDNGPYVSWGAFDARVMMSTVAGLYRVPNVRFDAVVVYTNNPYSGTQRGAGNPQMTFAVESQMDMLAEELGIDPIEFRLKNANTADSVTPQGMVITTCRLKECLETAAKSIGWKGRFKTAPNRGMGFASYFHVGGGARVYRSDGCGAIIKVDDFGKVTLLIGTTEIGTGSDTALAQIVAEELGVPLSKVEVLNDDTSVRPWDVGTHASRATFIGGNAALLAARRAKEQILHAASELLQARSTDLDIEDGVVYSKLNPAKTIPYEKVVRAQHFKAGGSMIVANAFYDPPTEMQDAGYHGNISATYGFGTQAALVEADALTGQIRVLKVVSVHDAGRIINPLGAEGQVQGGVVMGLGYALTEALILDEGRVMNPTLGDYKVLTIMEAPEIEPIFIESSDPAGPYGAKGVGEAGIIPIAATVANAIYDALKVRITELPMTPETIFRALTEGR